MIVQPAGPPQTDGDPDRDPPSPLPRGSRGRGRRPSTSRHGRLLCTGGSSAGRGGRRSRSRAGRALHGRLAASCLPASGRSTTSSSTRRFMTVTGRSGDAGPDPSVRRPDPQGARLARTSRPLRPGNGRGFVPGEPAHVRTGGVALSLTRRPTLNRGAVRLSRSRPPPSSAPLRTSSAHHLRRAEGRRHRPGSRSAS